jgi:peroxiredoxin
VAGFAALIAGFLVALQGPSALPLRIGSNAPELHLVRLSGEKLSVADLRGRVVFVNFWGTWCAPCRTEAPSLERMYRKLKPEGFEILAVSIDAPGARDEVVAFRDEFELSFPILLDPSKEVYRAYQATGVPETFMLDRDGRLVERLIGPRDWDQPRYQEAVRRLLTASGPAQSPAGVSGDG